MPFVQRFPKDTPGHRLQIYLLIRGKADAMENIPALINASPLADFYKLESKVKKSPTSDDSCSIRSILAINNLDLPVFNTCAFLTKTETLLPAGNGEGEDYYNSSIPNEVITQPKNTRRVVMENNRDDTIVIFAGYPDKMAKFISRNPGLRSRVPFTISFSDYSADEMVQIAELEAQRRGFVIGENAREKVASICQAATHHPEMGNGRFCRNLVEAAVMDYATRVYGGEEISDSDFTLREQDFSTPAILQEDRKSRLIGF